MTDKTQKKKGIEKKLYLLTGLLVGVSCILCFLLVYVFHLNSMKDVYFHSTEQAAAAANDVIYASDAFIFSEKILSDEFLSLRREAEETGNYGIIEKWMKENSYWDFYNYNTFRLQNIVDLFGVEDVYVTACQESGCYIILDTSTGFEYTGKRLTNAPELSNYENDGYISPTLSYSDEGWLCSAFIKIEDPSDQHHVFCGCDADMRVFVNKETQFVIQMAAFLLILMFVCGIAGLHFARKTISVPTEKISAAARKFADDNRKGDITAASDPDVHTGDEFEEINDSLIYLEQSILKQKKELEKINREKGRIDAELTVAKEIQMGMLPKDFLEDLSACDYYAVSKPARLVGGDFYNCIRIDASHVAFLVGDVADKGIPAALFMMTTQTLLQEHCLRGIAPGEVLEKVNNLLIASNQAYMFVTVWLGILDLKTGVLWASNAGHEYPILRHGDKTFRSFKDPHSFVLAGLPNGKYETYELTLQPGDALFVFSDGAHDACNTDGELFSENALVKAVNESDSSTAKSLVTDVLHRIEEYSSGAEQFDDITMLAVIYRGGENS